MTKKLVCLLLASVMLLIFVVSCNKSSTNIGGVISTAPGTTTEPVTTQPVTTEPVTTLPIITYPSVDYGTISAILNKNSIVMSADAYGHSPDELIGHTDDEHTNVDETMTRAEWLQKNIPFIDTPEDFLDRVYYFRWNNMLSNISRRASDGKYEFSEGGISTPYHGYIDCAQGAHVRDARWIRDAVYLNDYIDVTPDEEQYWNYLIAAILEKYYLDGDLEAIERNYEKLKSRFHSRDEKFDSEMGLYYLSNSDEGQELGVNGFDRIDRGMTYTASFTAEGSYIEALYDNFTDGAYWSNEGSGNDVDYIEIELGTTEAGKIRPLLIWFKGDQVLPKVSYYTEEGGWKSIKASFQEYPYNEDVIQLAYGSRTCEKIRLEFEGDVSIYELVLTYTFEFGGVDWKKVIRGEESYRVCANSYMAAAANALSEMAKLLGKTEDVEKYAEISKNIVQAMIENTWDETDSFFFELTQAEKIEIEGKESNAYTPWAFSLMPDTEEYSKAWKYLMDEAYFLAEYGITTLEKGNPHYMQYFNHECNWNGPIWPHTFSLILSALAEHLRTDSVTEVDKEDYFDLLMRYCNCHYDSDSDTDLAIRESHFPDSNSWKATSEEYNHSSFIDNVLSGLLGIRPTENGLEIDPIVPDDWDYFCVEDVSWHGKNVTVVYDKTGEKYGQGAGFMVALDGKIIFKSDSIEAMIIKN